MPRLLRLLRRAKYQFLAPAWWWLTNDRRDKRFQAWDVRLPRRYASHSSADEVGRGR